MIDKSSWACDLMNTSKKASAKDGEWVVAKVIMDAKGGGVIG